MATPQLSVIRTSVQSLLARKVTGRFFTTAEINEWINRGLVYLAKELEYLKNHAEFNGASYIPALGDDPKHYELPADFITLDANYRPLVNGIPRIGTTDPLFFRMAEKGIETDSENVQTLSDSFTENSFGIIWHYSADFVFKDQLEASNTGKVVWFTPNIESTDLVKYQYIAAPDVLVNDTDVPQILDFDIELLEYAAAYRAALKLEASNKKLYGGLSGIFKGPLNEYMANALKRYDNRNKVPDMVHKIFGARQMDNNYNSQGATPPTIGDSY